MEFVFYFQYEREIEQLRTNVELLKMKLEQAETGSNSHLPDNDSDHDSPDNMKNIIARYALVSFVSVFSRIH